MVIIKILLGELFCIPSTPSFPFPLILVDMLLQKQAEPKQNKIVGYS